MASALLSSPPPSCRLSFFPFLPLSSGSLRLITPFIFAILIHIFVLRTGLPQFPTHSIDSQFSSLQTISQISTKTLRRSFSFTVPYLIMRASLSLLLGCCRVQLQQSTHGISKTYRLSDIRRKAVLKGGWMTGLSRCGGWAENEIQIGCQAWSFRESLEVDEEEVDEKGVYDGWAGRRKTTNHRRQKRSGKTSWILDMRWDLRLCDSFTRHRTSQRHQDTYNNLFHCALWFYFTHQSANLDFPLLTHKSDLITHFSPSRTSRPSCWAKLAAFEIRSGRNTYQHTIISMLVQ
ncbi:hypothetical protein VTL71DRAFT_3077 [Oculimacula yallundae]|uniref:Uncharacterized protein n=1 Tax=Oculimacula yallundae TaxID=86028 RepID=A0ABR4C641_9HELO